MCSNQAHSQESVLCAFSSNSATTRTLTSDWDRLALDAGSGLLLVAPDGGVRGCNTEAARILAVNIDDLRGQPLGHAALDGLLINNYAKALQSDKPLLIVDSRKGLPLRVVMRRVLDPQDGPGVLCVLTPRLTFDIAEIDRKVYHVLPSTQPAGAPLSGLTESEKRILALLAEGHSTAQIALMIHRSPKTVEWHRAALGKKLGLRTRVDLARWANKHGPVAIPTQLAPEPSTRPPSALPH